MRILEQGDDYPGGLGSVLPDNSLLSPSPDAGAEKPGVCPQLQESTECVEECSSDNQCFDSLKCCQAGCSFICTLPNGNPSATWQGQGGAVKCCKRPGALGSGRKGTRDPGTLTPWKVEAVETRSSCALPCSAWGGCGRERGRGTRASLRCGPGGRSPPFLVGLDSLVHDGLPGTHSETLFRDPGAVASLAGDCGQSLGGIRPGTRALGTSCLWSPSLRTFHCLA